MKSIFRLSLVTLTLLAFFCTGAMAMERLKLSTTTSTDNSGLLDALLPAFEQKYDCKVDIIAVGTGKAIKLAVAGDVDVTMVHARSKEDKFVAGGNGVNRRDVMYNDYVVLGPKNDPAGIKSAKTAAEAFAKLATAKVKFISRGDDSGTHTMEKSLWKAAGVTPIGEWYVEAGQGMGNVITMANELQGYTISDRGTFVAYRDKVELPVLFAGDPTLFNPYGVIAVNPKLHPHVNYELAMSFIAFLTSPEGQKIIADFRKNGQPLFFVYE
jgi:tungstate transport system substrate-binding protein